EGPRTVVRAGWVGRTSHVDGRGGYERPVSVVATRVHLDGDAAGGRACRGATHGAVPDARDGRFTEHDLHPPGRSRLDGSQERNVARDPTQPRFPSRTPYQLGDGRARPPHRTVDAVVVERGEGRVGQAHFEYRA